jgi:hypothetical protein
MRCRCRVRRAGKENGDPTSVLTLVGAGLPRSTKIRSSSWRRNGGFWNDDFISGTRGLGVCTILVIAFQGQNGVGHRR